MLVSATAGIEDPAERRARRLADEALADHVEATPIEAFIDEWLSAPMWRTLPPARAQRDVRCRNTPAGLASSLRLAGQGAQQPVWDRLHTITAPTLVVTGEHDAKFAALGDRLAAGIAAADRLTIAGAGHAVPWEQPERFADEVIRWLAR